jgi:dynein heavy chain 2, cytosolic
VDELLEKFAQLDRSISQNSGHVLLSGRSGTGRRTVCQLITHMLDMVFETPKVTKEYSLSDFKKYLKSIMIQAGIEGQKVVLFVEDHQM